MRTPSVLRRARKSVMVRRFGGSADYWQNRYASGGNSGAGSYGNVAKFKAKVLNEFVASKGVTSVLEFGCGDGHQLSLAEYPSYAGVDVAPLAVKMCREKFAADPTKSFFVSTEGTGLRGDLTLSLDVILHLVEDDVFNRYMETLFASADRYVGIFAENLPDQRAEAHVRYRPFPNWVAEKRPDWKLVERVENPYSGGGETFADFYFFARATQPGERRAGYRGRHDRGRKPGDRGQPTGERTAAAGWTDLVIGPDRPTRPSTA